RRLSSPLSLSFFIPRHPLSSTLFPYTTLFRSQERRRRLGGAGPAESGGRGDRAPQPRVLHAAFAHRRPRRPSARRRREHRHGQRSEEHTSELQSRFDLVCRLLLEKKKRKNRD